MTLTFRLVGLSPLQCVLGCTPSTPSENLLSPSFSIPEAGTDLEIQGTPQFNKASFLAPPVQLHSHEDCH